MPRAVDRYTVVIIGSGFGGQCAAMALNRMGLHDYRILERRSFMGGTWCQNRYPGAAVDVQSPLYSIAAEPFDWSRMFAEQSELEAYTRHIIEKNGLHRNADVDTNVESMAWDAARQEWHISTSGRRDYCAQFVINASGPLSTPVVPDFDGREAFKGPAFHTNDWDHGVDLTGRRVAVVGSGASAAQVIPAIVDDVAELHVFQRSAHWVIPRPDREFSPVQRAILRNPLAYRALRTAIYWGLETRVIGFKYSRTLLELIAQRRALSHLDRQVPDPALRAKLTPNYTIGCKRIILSNTLYPALTKPQTTLHDRTDGIARIDAKGIHTVQGRYVELDAIVWATGYDATDGAISYPVVGVDGLALADLWDPYPRAYLGTAVPGFPNLFIVTGPNTGIGHTSAIFVIEAQMEYIARCIRATRDRHATCIEVRSEAEREWTQMIHSEMRQTVWQMGGCTSWYQSRSGHVVAMYPGFSFMFRRHANRFRAEHHRFE